MITVYKYELPNKSYFELELPKNSRILKVDAQGYNNVIWAFVNTDAKPEIRRFWKVGTGFNLDTRGNVLTYIGTWQDGDTDLVWHLFEVLKNPYMEE
jgi:hypothetical protein